MKKLGIDTIYNTLHSYELSIIAKAQTMKNQGNKKKEEIYNAKVNAIRECIRLIRKIQ